MLGTPTRDRKAERRAAVRREILDAAWDIARESGLTQITLRDVAARIGMQAPSLYTHFDSKMAIYDAMFAEAWDDYGSNLDELDAALSAHPRTALHQISHHFYDYAIADHPRYQLMNERVIPGFEPTAASYTLAERVYAHGAEILARAGLTEPADIDLWTAVLSGLATQQVSNDPGGDRWVNLVDRAVDLLLD